MDQSEPRRADDEASDDYRDRRRPITGDEMRIGVGKYAITVRGGITIIVVLGLAILGLQGFMIREHDRAQMQVSRDHQTARQEFADTLRLFACVSTLTQEEKAQWRASRDTRNALMGFCPSLLMPTANP